jgi:hypothetical protein
VNARVPDQAVLEASIQTMVERFEREHQVEVSSVWVEHRLPDGVEVTVTTRARLKVKAG